MIPVAIDSVISVGIDAVIPVIDTTLCHVKVIDPLFHRCYDPRWLLRWLSRWFAPCRAIHIT
jgi:hypothetical protein